MSKPGDLDLGMYAALFTLAKHKKFDIKKLWIQNYETQMIDSLYNYKPDFLFFVSNYKNEQIIYLLESANLFPYLLSYVNDESTNQKTNMVVIQMSPKENSYQYIQYPLLFNSKKEEKKELHDLIQKYTGTKLQIYLLSDVKKNIISLLQPKDFGFYALSSYAENCHQIVCAQDYSTNVESKRFNYSTNLMDRRNFKNELEFKWIIKV